MSPQRARATLGGVFCAVVFTASHGLADSYDDDGDKPSRPGGGGWEDEAEPKEKPLSAGGLSAPEALPDTTDGRSATEKELERADREDSGRGLEFVWASGEFGVSALDLTALGGEIYGGALETGGAGWVAGGALGVRVLYFTLGARFRTGPVADFDVWSLVGEAGMRLPIGAFEPFAVLGVGYAATSGLGVSAGADRVKLDVGGFDLRAALGADYYFSDTFSLGAQSGVDFLFLGRDGVTGALPVGVDPSASREASATGFAFFATALVGLHF